MNLPLRGSAPDKPLMITILCFVFIYLFLEAPKAHRAWPLAMWCRDYRLLLGH